MVCSVEETKVMENALVAGVEKYVSFELADAGRGEEQEYGVMAGAYGAIEAHLD
jgi:hypothetical protein